MVRVLYVEDDEQQVRSISRLLRRYGFVVDTAKSVREVFELIARTTYDVLLLDFMLSDTLTGPELCFALRERGSSAGAIMLSGLSDLDSKLVAFQAGVQDYLTKPCQFAELVARVHAVAERSPGSAESLRTPSLVPKVQSERDGLWLVAADGRIELTRTEYSTLLALEEARGATLSSEALCRAVWGTVGVQRQRSLYVHMNRLRAKLEPNHAWRLITVKGTGYRFERTLLESPLEQDVRCHSAPSHAHATEDRRRMGRPRRHGV